MSDTQGWRRCSSCKAWIDFDHPYYVCSVSTCNRKRTALVFCSVSCWEVHVPMMRHRDSGAVEQRSPTREAHARAERAEQAEREAAARKAPASGAGSPASGSGGSGAPGGAGAAARPAAAGSSAGAPQGGSREPRRTVVRRGAAREETPSPSDPVATLSDDVPIDVLIVASKLKTYIRARSGMNTSDGVMKMLSDHVRALCEEAIRSAVEHERKTVMDRDFPPPGPAPGSKRR